MVEDFGKQSRQKPATGRRQGDDASRKGNPVTVLGFSTAHASSASRDLPSSATEFNSVDHLFIQRLLRRYPNGQLWSFDEDGSMIASDEDPLAFSSDSASPSSSIDSNPRSGKAESILDREGKIIFNCFPGVRQVLYAPIYDSASSRYICACFAVSLREVPVFTSEIEVAFARAFLNSVAAEWDRVSTSIADRQKGDFISSFSHVR